MPFKLTLVKLVPLVLRFTAVNIDTPYSLKINSLPIESSVNLVYLYTVNLD